MSRKREMLLASGTLACALATGFVMQSGKEVQLRYQASKIAAETKHLPEPLDTQEIILTSSPTPPRLANVVVDRPAPVLQKISRAARDPHTQATSRKPSCDVSLSATPQAAAMVDLALSAPCHAAQVVRLSHEGMEIMARTRADGTLNIDIPALAAKAVFRAAFSDGLARETTVVVESVTLYDRALIQWSGPAGLQIHAREHGAEYGDVGHVWQENPRSPLAVANDTGGFLSSFVALEEAAPVAAEVYTYPASLADREAGVSLTIEVEITETNCDRAIAGIARKFMGGNQLQSHKITLPEIGCDAVGEYLVLNNLLADLRVASR